MLALLLGSAAFAGAAYAAWQMIQSMKDSASGEEPGDGVGKEDGSKKKADPMSERDRLLAEIVRATKFATKQVEVGQRAIGSERRPSITPADEIEVRPIRGVSELPQVLPSMQVADDELFFAQLAAGELPVTQDIERVELTEPVMGDPRKVLVVVQDTSGSMEHHDRIRWAIRLCHKLIDRCIEEKAECILLPFSNHPETLQHAKDEEECLWLQERLPGVLNVGGGTDIDAALQAAIGIIEGEGFDEARIILITDGTEEVHSGEIRNRLRDSSIFLHTVCIAGDHSQLKDISNLYHTLWA